MLLSCILGLGLPAPGAGPDAQSTWQLHTTRLLANLSQKFCFPGAYCSTSTSRGCRVYRNASKASDGHVQPKAQRMTHCHWGAAEVFKLHYTELLTKDEEIERLKHVIEGLASGQPDAAHT